MTPAASWRPQPRAAVFIVGLATCQCGAFVWFGRSQTRVQGVTVLGEIKAWREWGRYAVHDCGRVAA